MRTPTMTRAHYQLIADCLRESAAPGVVVEEFARRLATTNPRFDRGRFLAAAGGVSSGPRVVARVDVFDDYSGPEKGGGR